MRFSTSLVALALALVPTFALASSELPRGFSNLREVVARELTLRDLENRGIASWQAASQGGRVPTPGRRSNDDLEARMVISQGYTRPRIGTVVRQGRRSFLISENVLA